MIMVLLKKIILSGSSILMLILIAFLGSCDPVIDPGNGGGNGGVVKETGTLEIEFRVPGSFLPPNRVLRADLSLAENAELLYKGDYFHVENVYNSKLMHQFKLEPGYYYYQAGIVCIAMGDSCSAAGFPGGQFGMKWAIGAVNIEANKLVHIVPQFTQ